MNVEANRLDTFVNWPYSAPVDPIRIAKAGFYYTGQGTEVQCYSCRGKVSEWNYGDQVMQRHRWLNRDCPFLLNHLEAGNVPLLLGSEWLSFDLPADGVEGRPREIRHGDETYELTEDDDMYKNDALRLLSFINWTDTSVSREALVNAGFYHVGMGRLRCAWCGGELAAFNDFGSLGPPLQVHRLYFPRCMHAIALETQQGGHISPPSSPLNTPPLLNPPEENDEAQSSGAAHNSRLLTGGGGSWRSLGVVSGGAKHPRYAAVATRLATYTRWPADRQQKPRSLAEAGFFHTGTGDQVRCFYCDGGLGRWETGDAPWSEHARWFPHCGYVLLTKGQEFVNGCKRDDAGRRSQTEENGPMPPNPQNTIPLIDSQIEECMESPVVLDALAAGLDAARVRRAIVRRLRNFGSPYPTPEALIDAVLGEQLDEEAWNVETQHNRRLARDIMQHTLREIAAHNSIPGLDAQRPVEPVRNSRLARDIIQHTLRGLAPRNSTAGLSQLIPPLADRHDSDAQSESSDRSHSPSPARPPSPACPPVPAKSEKESKSEAKKKRVSESDKDGKEASTTKDQLSLEEENRLLKEARMCKVCMDNEVSVVFLPCGHLVACSGCGAALPHCPLCRAVVRALVRAYLA